MAMEQQQGTLGAQQQAIVCGENAATEQQHLEDLHPEEASGGTSDDDVDDERQGTTASARFNMLSTMVGGGSLSLPLAFQKSGNALLAPLLLLLVAGITEFCFRVHVGSARLLAPCGISASQTRPGQDSFESVTARAFGRHMHVLSMALVTAMCFFGTVGYAVLLRDMLQPITDWVWHGSGGGGGGSSGPTWHNNLTMLTVVLAVTPLCTLRTLTSLQRFGAASMLSVLILGSCVLYRSVECNLGLLLLHDEQPHEWKTFQFFPNSLQDLLDVFPLYVSCFVCHYNLLPVHNDLRNPTAPRVGWWLRSTVWSATLFYLIMGVAGSAYGHCTATGKVSGNILLDFPEQDPLLLVGRMCLAITITLAFPMLTIPARDIMLRSCPNFCCASKPRPRQPSSCPQEEATTTTASSNGQHASNNFAEGTATATTSSTSLTEPLLLREQDVEDGQQDTATILASDSGPSFCVRLVASVMVFWSAAAVASSVSSIDVVWDLLGSSLSILLSYLIPCGAYLVIVQMRHRDGDGRAPPHDLTNKTVSKWLAWALIVAFVPLMIISTFNAVHNTFFRRSTV